VSTDERFEEIRSKQGSRERWSYGRDIEFLLAEIDRLKTWDGLMEILDEHYPPEVFDGSSGDPGARIVVLLREVDRLRRENAELQKALKRTLAILDEKLPAGGYRTEDAELAEFRTLLKEADRG
jgi:hypothetical protein